MVSKVFLLLALLAIVVLISSEVAAKDLTQTSTTDKKDGTEVEDGKYGLGRYPGGGYYGGYPGGRSGGRRGQRGRYGGRCGRYGCCYRGYNGCTRCCAYAGEAIERHIENKPHN